MQEAYELLKNQQQDGFRHLQQTAAEYERKYRGCSQASAAPFIELFGWDQVVYKCACGLAGGIGLTTESECGAFTAGVLIISAVLGRGLGEMEDLEKLRSCNMVIRQYREHFIGEFGSTLCSKVQTGMFGRSYRILDPEDNQAFEEAGAHTDKCPDVAARAVGLIAETLIETLKDRGR